MADDMFIPLHGCIIGEEKPHGVIFNPTTTFVSACTIAKYAMRSRDAMSLKFCELSVSIIGDPQTTNVISGLPKGYNLQIEDTPIRMSKKAVLVDPFRLAKQPTRYLVVGSQQSFDGTVELQFTMNMGHGFEGTWYTPKFLLSATHADMEGWYRDYVRLEYGIDI